MKNQNSSLSRPRQSLFEEAAEAWRQQDYQRTIEILKRATQQQPNNSKLLLNLAEAYGLRFEYQEAERILQKVVAIASNKAEVLAEAGRRCHKFGQPEMGNRYFSRAAEIPGASASVFVALAEFEEGHSRIEAALALLERALQAQPECPGALLAQARLHRLSGRLEQGESLLRTLLRTATGETAIKAWYELGTNLDRQGFYEQAMVAFLQAKVQLLPSSIDYVPQLKKMHAEFRTMEETLSDNTLKRWTMTCTELRPARRFALLCGHPRSGTTLLEQILDAHPDIVVTDETSILLGEAYPVLSNDVGADASMLEILESASIEALQQARAGYLRFTELFSGETIGNRLLIDKNPAMDLHIPLVVRIFPEAVFVVAIRDPRDVCISSFMLPMPPGQLSALYLSLEATVSQYVSVMGFSRAIRSRLRNPQMEVRYEDVIRDLEKTSRQLLAFLGVEWNPAVLRYDAHAKTKPLRCGIDESVAKPIFTRSVERWRHYQKYLEPFMKQLAPFIEAFGYS
jgi:tetratricopeptide (TPR) repeat protein